MAGDTSLTLSLIILVIHIAHGPGSSAWDQDIELYKNVGLYGKRNEDYPFKMKKIGNVPEQASVYQRHILKGRDGKYNTNGITTAEREYPLTPFCDKWCFIDTDNRHLHCRKEFGDSSINDVKLLNLLQCMNYAPKHLPLSGLFSMGFNFGAIQNGSFRNISLSQNITFVDLIECNVTKLESNAFLGLIHLKTLYIVDVKGKRGISHLNYYTLHHCPKIWNLGLGKVKKLDIDTFAALPNLLRMEALHKSLLRYKGAFRFVKNLRILWLDGVGFKKTPSFIPSYIPWIHSLKLDNNFLTNLSFYGSFKTAHPFTLSAENNRITKITRAEMSQFRHSASLSLNLKMNDVKLVELDFLADIKEFKDLNLEQNIHFGNRNFFTLLNNLKSKKITGSLNLIGCGIVLGKIDASILQPLEGSQLQQLYLGDNVLGVVEADTFEAVKDLELLQISNVMEFSSKCFRPLRKVKALRIDGMLTRHQRVECKTINLNELRTIEQLEIVDVDPVRISFQFDRLYLRRLTLYNMNELFDFFRGQVYQILKFHKSYLEVTLSGNLLFRYDDHELCSMFSNIVVPRLDLSDNYFSKLPTCMFHNSNITFLHLKLNRITHIQRGLLEIIHNLQWIDLSQNVIQFIDGNALTNIHPFYESRSYSVVSIRNNLLPCNCEMEPFRKWLQHLPANERGTIVLHDKYCAAPAIREHEDLLKAKIPWMECNRDLFIKTCIICGTVVVLMIATAISLLKYFWKDIKYRQMVRRARKHNGYIPIDDIEDETYDAFVSYHPEKRIWVQDVMTAKLGKGDLQFTLMFDINILPNGRESYFGGIFTHMDRSRYVIFLVTRGWMKEGMNEFEMEAAIDLLKQSKRHTLIVILMENIPKKEMSQTLKLMVRNNVCLKWSENEREQRKFWRDLKLELGKKKYKYQCLCYYER